jgi:hypothetical protein
LIPPYLPERFTLLSPKHPVDNFQNLLHMALNRRSQIVLGDAATARHS